MFIVQLVVNHDHGVVEAQGQVFQFGFVQFLEVFIGDQIFTATAAGHNAVVPQCLGVVALFLQTALVALLEGIAALLAGSVYGAGGKAVRTAFIR